VGQYAALAGLAPAEAGHPVHLPFSARVLVPAVVRALPVEPEQGFRWLAVAALTVFLFAVRPLAVFPGKEEGAGWAAVAVAASLWFPTLYAARHPFLVDGVFLMAWTLALLAVVRGRVAWAAAALCAAVLTREAAFFLVPAAAVLWWGEKPWKRTARDLAVLALPALVLYLVVLGAVGGSGFESGHELGAAEGAAALRGMAGDFVAGLGGALRSSALLSEPRALATGFLLAGGLAVLAVAVGWRRLPPQARRRAVAGFVAVVPMLLLASDAGRMLGAAVPFWIPVALVAWGSLPQRAAPMAPALAAVSNLLLAAVVLTAGPAPAEAALAGLAVLLGLAPLPFLVTRPERVALRIAPLLASPLSQPSPSQGGGTRGGTEPHTGQETR
jgi:hypothetical protein